MILAADRGIITIIAMVPRVNEENPFSDSLQQQKYSLFYPLSEKGLPAVPGEFGMQLLPHGPVGCYKIESNLLGHWIIDPCGITKIRECHQKI